MEYCYHVGEVAGLGSTSLAGAGGVVGKNDVETKFDLDAGGWKVLGRGTVRYCYQIGAVSGSGVSGGVVAANQGIVENCYNIGSVRNIVSNTAGGIVGNNLSVNGVKDCAGTVTNCYNFGKVTGSGNSVGGVAGSNDGTVTSCYFLTGTATKGIGDDSSSVSATSKTAEEFKAQTTFTDWNFSGVWKMSTALGRPILTKNPEPEPHVHNWDAAWEKNDTHHWHECTGEGTCDVTENSGKDGYAAFGVKEYWTCSDCGKHFSDANGTAEIASLDAWQNGDGKIDKVSHDFSGDYLSDADGHWHKCKHCTATDTKAAHVYTNDTDATCNTCDYTRTVAPDKGQIKGEVETGTGAPPVTADTSTLEELAGTPQAGETITVKLTVEKKDDTAEGRERSSKRPLGKQWSSWICRW